MAFALAGGPWPALVWTTDIDLSPKSKFKRNCIATHSINLSSKGCPDNGKVIPVRSTDTKRGRNRRRARAVECQHRCRSDRHGAGQSEYTLWCHRLFSDRLLHDAPGRYGPHLYPER